MKRFFLIAVPAFALVLLTLVLLRIATMNTPGSSEREVEKLEREVGEAITRRDTAALDRLLADDFIVTNPAGQVMTKKEAIAALTAPEYDLESLVNDEIKVRVFGDVALATALGTAKGRYKGQDASGQFRYLRVWVKRQGCWQAVAAQSTNVPKHGASPN
jgi:ketosteroid isomerase-like protein